eukprot:CAMPEP_0197523970 /NCGR_PEP_ID=MMETSP1318-20131121/8775_1 /TAXON_ID=552666 /ORGANISM="Partenskyella glossopodia, Strain RCC365" /LENGTH=135 /DNA_ID=CAMNT_0043076805 /DNA_START=52 /DNA_END=459 /DNA_ORIENTATION=+
MDLKDKIFANDANPEHIRDHLLSMLKLLKENLVNRKVEGLRAFGMNVGTLHRLWTRLECPYCHAWCYRNGKYETKKSGTRYNYKCSKKDCQRSFASSNHKRAERHQIELGSLSPGESEDEFEMERPRLILKKRKK